MGDAEQREQQRTSRRGSDARLAEIERAFLVVYPLLGECARRQMPLLEEAREVQQECGAKLWAYWTRDPAGFEAPPDPRRFAERVVRNHLTDLARRGERWAALIDADADVDKLAVRGNPDPYDHAVGRELEERVERYLLEMPEKRGAAWKLRYDGYSYADIARKLGITESAARSHVDHGTAFIAERERKYLGEGR